MFVLGSVDIFCQITVLFWWNWGRPIHLRNLVEDAHPGKDAGEDVARNPNCFGVVLWLNMSDFFVVVFSWRIAKYLNTVQTLVLKYKLLGLNYWAVYQSRYSLNSGRMNFKLPTAFAPDWINNYQNTNKQNIQFSCFLVEVRSYGKVGWQDVFCFSRFNGYPLRDKQICAPNIFVKGKVRKAIALCNRGALENQRKFTQRNNCLCFFQGRYQYTPYKYQLPPK